jgi:glutamyl-tRNA synthetase
VSNGGVRVRFAPSPTGNVHIGNIRAAIFNWLYARHEGGRFLLRIEDTDRERSTPEAVENLLGAMRWLGLDFDEPPLYQTSRLEAYREVAERLIAAGAAYRSDLGDPTRGECVVFRAHRTVSFEDVVKGRLRKDEKQMKDFVILRSDGTPVFHLANVVDDIHMRVTHVIRGDDHVDNTFNHLLLYEALGAAPPRFAHLPMLVNDAGKPYSKRDGAAFVGDFRERGYLPEALFNFLALLGWSPGDNREKMTRQEIIEAFTLERVSSSPARVNAEKLDWLNGRYLTEMPFERFKEMLEPEMRKAGLSLGALDDGRLKLLINVERERIKTLADFVSQTRYFFDENVVYDQKAVEKVLVKQGGKDVLPGLREKLAALPRFKAEALTVTIEDFAREKGLPMGKVAQPIRVAVTGGAVSPPIGETLEIIGRERALKRIDTIPWQGRSF